MASGGSPSLSIRGALPFYFVAGDKSGVSEKRFYRELIRKADARFDVHLIWLKKTRR